MIFEINFDNIFSKLFRILIIFLNICLKHFTLKKSVIHRISQKIITKAHNKLKNCNAVRMHFYLYNYICF